MSRIGKQPIQIPDKTEVEIEGNLVVVKGPKGELKRKFLPEIEIEKKDDSIVLKPHKESRQLTALWGTYRSLISSMVKGVNDGFEKALTYEGIGFRAEVKNDSKIESGQVLELNVGFSHPVRIPAPKGITFKVEKNRILVSGIDKELVGQVAANIRKVKPPEPYKGKGIKYEDEIIQRKAGKKAVGATG